MQPSKIFMRQSTRKRFSQLSQLRSITSKNELITVTSTALIFNDFLQGQRIIGLRLAAPEGGQKIFQKKVRCWLPWFTKKTLVFQTIQMVTFSVSLGIGLPQQTTTQKFFLSAQALKNLASLPQADYKPRQFQNVAHV